MPAIPPPSTWPYTSAAYMFGDRIPLRLDREGRSFLLDLPDFLVIDALVEESLGSGDALSTMATYNLDIVEMPGFGESLLVGSSVTATVIDTLEIVDTTFLTAGMSASIAENLGLAHTLVGNIASKAITADVSELFEILDAATLDTVLGALLTERINIVDPIVLEVRPGARVADGLVLSDMSGAGWGKAVRENLRLSTLCIGNYHVSISVADGVRFRDTVRIGVNVEAQETIGLADLLSAARGLKIIDRLGLADVLVANAHTNITVLERIRFRDSLARFFGAEVSDGIGLSDALTGKARAMQLLLEGLGVGDVMTPMVAFKAVLSDGLNITDEQLLQMIWSGTLIDDILLDVGYFSSGPGEFTAWTMNTRTNAVSEYQNYAFNSFARTGNKYLGASSTGLYELVGDTDEGDDIVATLRSGYMQFGGTRLSRLKEAYIALRAPNDKMILKIITGDGVEYVYQVDTRSMRNTKVHMGKGQRARYFAFELISAGQDFDLDTLEFVPIVVQRRV